MDPHTNWRKKSKCTHLFEDNLITIKKSNLLEDILKNH